MDGRTVILADRPAVPLDRALRAYGVAEAEDRGAVTDDVAVGPAVREGAVVEIRPIVDVAKSDRTTGPVG